jgi:hypothetical protein
MVFLCKTYITYTVSFGGLHRLEWFMPDQVTVNKPRTEAGARLRNNKILIIIHFNLCNILFTIPFFTFQFMSDSAVQLHSLF